MAKYRFKLYRRSIVDETFYVDADSEEEALEIAENEPPDPDGDPTWLEWLDEGYEIDTAEPPEIIDPLYRMVKDHEDQKKVDLLVD